MLWIFATAYDYTANINAFPTLEALIEQLEAEFPDEDGLGATLAERVSETLRHNHDFHDARIRAVDPATGCQVAVDIDAVCASADSAHARLALHARVADDLAANGKALLFS